MIVTNRSRRQFLLGAGGFTLALPLLPSLLQSSAKAQSFTPEKRFIALATAHGGAWNKNMFPDSGMLTESKQLYPNHEIKRGKLRASVKDGKAALSRVLTAKSELLSERIVGKLNVMRGIDLPFYLGHHTGGHLGNFARLDRAFESPDLVQSLGGNRVTIDQVMANSKSFYTNDGSVRAPSLHVGLGGGKAISWGYESRKNKTGAQVVPTVNTPRELFDIVFVAPKSEQAEAPKRVPLVDRVLESYKQTTSGRFGDGRKLSSEDRARLDQHIEKLEGIERRLKATPQRGCGMATAPKNVTDAGRSENGNNLAGSTEYYQLMNDVLVIAFQCGTSRIATVYSSEAWDTYSGDWHMDIAHGSSNEDRPQETLIAGYSRFFERCFLDLVNKLDVEEAEGKTYLDSTLVQWTQESGSASHEPLSLPVVTAGTANGYFDTGYYVDYRNLNGPKFEKIDANKDKEGLMPGLLYQRWLATALQSMDVSAAEYAPKGEKGYGSLYKEDWKGNPSALWPQRVFDDCNVPMPFVTTRG